jgi:hypothetical protein
MEAKSRTTAQFRALSRNPYLPKCRPILGVADVPFAATAQAIVATGRVAAPDCAALGLN